MKQIIQITLSAAILLVNITTTFGQTTSDKIIFLSDFYTTFTIEVKKNNENADSIYKETIQNPICQKYFQKSEYSGIVEQFFATPIKNTSELKKSIERISQNQEAIKTKIREALKKSRQYIENDSLTIYIIPVDPKSRQIIEHMSGIMGLTAGSKQIILTIEPDILGWESMLEYAVAHEFNHTYWTKENFRKLTKWTLLDYLVFEGRGDYFAHLIYPNVTTPWTIALTENQKLDLWEKIKPNLQSEDIHYQREVMFGSRNYPGWGGYSLGYDIILTALTKNKKLNVVDWANFEANKILELSKYK